MTSGDTAYKKRNIGMWDEVAPRYHRRWAGADTGPWESSQKLVELAGIRAGDTVLDLGCGTGAVTKKIAGVVGKRGFVVGADMSLAAIRIAKRTGGKDGRVDFVNCDAERPGIRAKFDAVTCQYALFYFPDSQAALKNMAGNLKEDGVVGISVHGNHTPYFTSILDVVTRFIPDYLPAGSPRLDRFGTVPALRGEVRRAGFRRISVREFVFSFSPGTFEDYWRGYKTYVSRPVREKLRGLPRQDKIELRRQVREGTVPYTKRGGRIVFPWQVLILTARPPSS